MRGRKPTPTALKILKGERPSRINANEPMLQPSMPVRPSFLRGEALAEWERIGPLLLEARILTALDGAALGAYCENFAIWRVAVETIKAEGILASTEIGAIKVHPAVVVAQQCEKALLRSLVEFGCTPSSRSRLHIAPPELRDPLTEFLSASKRKPSGA